MHLLAFHGLLSTFTDTVLFDSLINPVSWAIIAYVLQVNKA